VRQVFDHPLALQQLDHLSQAILQALLGFLYFDFSHRRTPLPAVGTPGDSIRQIWLYETD
jgi:hypothetical protein